MKGVIVLSTFPSEESAAEVANKVVSAKICACVNFAKVRSVYSWKGKIEDQGEYIAFFKTTIQSAKKLKAEIARLHPYEVPEIVELKISDVAKPYLTWLITQSSGDGIPKKRHNASKR